jgi:hypothetical protein
MTPKSIHIYRDLNIELSLTKKYPLKIRTFSQYFLVCT